MTQSGTDPEKVDTQPVGRPLKKSIGTDVGKPMKDDTDEKQMAEILRDKLAKELLEFAGEFPQSHRKDTDLTPRTEPGDLVIVRFSDGQYWPAVTIDQVESKNKKKVPTKWVPLGLDYSVWLVRIRPQVVIVQRKHLFIICRKPNLIGCHLKSPLLYVMQLKMLYAGGLFYPKVQGQLGLKKIFERLVNLILDEDGLKDMEPTERLSLMEEMADRFKAAPPLVSHCEVCDQIDRKAKSINWPLLQCRECFKGFHSYCLKEQKKYQVMEYSVDHSGTRTPLYGSFPNVLEFDADSDWYCPNCIASPILPPSDIHDIDHMKPEDPPIWQTDEKFQYMCWIRMTNKSAETNEEFDALFRGFDYFGNPNKLNKNKKVWKYGYIDSRWETDVIWYAGVKDFVTLSSGKKTAKMKYVKKENHCKAEQDENDETKEESKFKNGKRKKSPGKTPLTKKKR